MILKMTDNNYHCYCITHRIIFNYRILFKKIARVNTETAILSVIPGALSQMLIMAEENKRANILVVSLTQTSRVIFVVILVPLISYLFSSNQTATQSISHAKPLTQVLHFPEIILIIMAIALVYFIMAKSTFLLNSY